MKKESIYIELSLEVTCDTSHIVGTDSVKEPLLIATRLGLIFPDS